MQTTRDKPFQICADEAIRHRDQDRLDRVRLADAIAEQAIAVPPALGFVIGVVGEWGSGKTSLLNMVSESVESRGGTVVFFDPWMFSGAEELVARFLQELGTQLSEEGREPGSKKLAAAGDAMLNYAKALEPLAWLPGIGAWMARTAAVAKGLEVLKDGREAQPQSVISSRDTVREALAHLEQRVLVVVDD
ncbi:MAG TPA: P-loop NTPase fold protein, partial [Solirubrobacteraceae bacterium]|nr:P-loop NTPase fold protein [Solirubrobacteraceae bacterium]